MNCYYSFIVDFVASINVYSIRLLVTRIYMKYPLFASTLITANIWILANLPCPLPPPPKEVGSIRSRSKIRNNAQLLKYILFVNCTVQITDNILYLTRLNYLTICVT